MLKAIRQYFLRIMLMLFGQPLVPKEPAATGPVRPIGTGPFRSCARSEVEKVVDLDKAVAESRRPKVGDVFNCGAHKWVDVLNPAGISNGNNHRDFGESASIKEGGTLTVIEVDQVAERATVIYLIPYPAYGAQAPSGTIFHIGFDELLRTERLYHEIKEKKAAAHQLLRRALEAFERDGATLH